MSLIRCQLGHDHIMPSIAKECDEAFERVYGEILKRRIADATKGFLEENLQLKADNEGLAATVCRQAKTIEEQDILIRACERVIEHLCREEGDE